MLESMREINFWSRQGQDFMAFFPLENKRAQTFSENADNFLGIPMFETPLLEPLTAEVIQMTIKLHLLMPAEELVP